MNHTTEQPSSENTGSRFAARKDSFDRIVDYLRISVTDRCNERCLYCMPEGYTGWAERENHLNADELLRVVETAAGLGFRKFRLTGGEPLVRRDIVEIARRIWEVPGIETLGVSTNGMLLNELALPLKQAGVRSVNISLDTLNPGAYKNLTGGSLNRVLAGIDAALAAGFERVKLNAVLMRGINDDQILPLIRFAALRNCPMRFIELMPIGPDGPINDDHFYSIAETMKTVATVGKLVPTGSERFGHGPARYFRMGNALIGFIGAMSCADFCSTCNKMRLTADGKIRPCLGHEDEIDLKLALRSGISNVRELMEFALTRKPEKHIFEKSEPHQRPMTAVGG
jgi:cyclic pyranopterin phosphate synthase